MLFSSNNTRTLQVCAPMLTGGGILVDYKIVISIQGILSLFVAGCFRMYMSRSKVYSSKKNILQ